MCRLAGYYLTKKTKLAETEARENLREIIKGQEGGGGDATGIGFIPKKGFYTVRKSASGASDFIKKWGKIWGDMHPRGVMGHCRAMTLGVATDNKNNHPVYTKAGTLACHNGVIGNHAELFLKHGLIRDGQVDSEIIPQLVEKFAFNRKKTTAIEKATDEIAGTLTASLVFADEPENLYLVVRDNPLYLAYDKKRGIIYYATDGEVLESTLIEYRYILGLFAEPLNASRFIIEKATPGGYKLTPGEIERFEIGRPPATFPNYSGYTPAGKWNGGTTASEQNELRVGFSALARIKKPSAYTTAELEARLQHLTDKEYTTPLFPSEETELKRIEAMLMARTKQGTLLLSPSRGGEYID